MKINIHTFKFILCGLILSLLCSCNQKQNLKEKQNINKENKDSIVGQGEIVPSKLLKLLIEDYNSKRYKLAEIRIDFLVENYGDTINNINIKDIQSRIKDKILRIESKLEEEKRQEENKILKSSLDKMRREINNDGDTLFYDKTSPKFDSKDCFLIYIKKKPKNVELHLKIKKTDMEFLELESCMVTVDGNEDYNLEGKITKAKTKGKKVYYIETLEKLITSYEDKGIVKQIAEGKDVTLVFVGKTKFKSKRVSKERRIAFKNVLDAYRYLTLKK